MSNLADRDSGPPAGDPGILTRLEEEEGRARSRAGVQPLAVDLGGLTLAGPWKIYGPPQAHRTRLVLVDLVDLRPETREEAALQARLFADHYKAEGYSMERGTGPAWIEVLGTLAVRLESWDRCLRHLRAGLASTGGSRWRGWHHLLAVDPQEYALRRSFLVATRWGHGVPDGSRFEQGLAWHPASPALREPWEAWIRGDAPEPSP